MQHPLLEIERLRPHIDRWVKETGHTYESLSSLCGVSRDTIARITRDTPYVNKSTGEKKWISFDIADKIITKGLGNPMLWWTEFEDVYTKPLSLTEFDRKLLGIDTEDFHSCSICKEEKPKEEFFLRSNTPRGRDYMCKACR